MTPWALPAMMDWTWTITLRIIERSPQEALLEPLPPAQGQNDSGARSWTSTVGQREYDPPNALPLARQKCQWTRRMARATPNDDLGCPTDRRGEQIPQWFPQSSRARRRESDRPHQSRG